VDENANMEEQLIKEFYTCFQQRNWKGMVDCYGEDIIFYDPVFENLEGCEVHAMWEMLLSRAKDLTLDFGDISIEESAGDGTDKYGGCRWVATYTFTATGRKVVNRVKARFAFSEGKIVEHQDEFNLWKWSGQALGWTGFLLGGTSLMQNKIRRNARKSLDKFMEAQGRAGK
jgi:ketosteroid isomerase-like protein